MNRYPLWKYLVILVALVFGALYTAPNFFGDTFSVQINSAKATVKVDRDIEARVTKILSDGKLHSDGMLFDTSGIQPSLQVKFANADAQFKAKALLDKELNTDPTDPIYNLSLNLLPNTPAWLQAFNANPMHLGLDLRGGVHFLVQVHTDEIVDARVKGLQSSVRAVLKDKEIRHAGISRSENTIVAKFKDAETRTLGKNALLVQMNDVLAVDGPATEDGGVSLLITIKPAALKSYKDEGVKQNIAALSKRVNALGVSEPTIQQQGSDRIIVELPGVQDVARAKELIGRTATLEVRLVDETVLGPIDGNTAIPYGSELFKVGRGAPAVLYDEAVITGSYITGASATYDQHQQPAVAIDLNGDGGRKMLQGTSGKIGKKMAIVLFEVKNGVKRGELLTVATIQAELSSHFQITGMGSPVASSDLALLLRSGSLSASMDIIEDRVIGPQLGVDNIQKGSHSVMYGFVAIAIFMVVYYMLFGFFSVTALTVNLLLLVALLSLLQATLTLPGIAAIALALGMAIDSNVLINERIREELRGGSSPQAAIAAGFDHAWATILDSNVTTFIVGASLWIFGSGPIKGFATVHCLGILTSMFSAVFVSRGVVNLWYGRKKKLSSISIGQIWKPAE